MQAASLKLPNRKHNWVNYAIMYFCFALGGVPYFHIPKLFKVIFVLALSVIFLLKKRNIDKKYLGVIFVLFVIFLFQVLYFGSGNFINFGYILIIVTIPYLALRIVGEDFPIYFINITYVFAVISLIFYIASSLSPSFYDWTSTLPSEYNLDPNPVLKKGFIIYTWERVQFQGFLRNPGPFWEPSVYANYLNLAIILNTIYTGVLFNKKNIVLIIALITTLSTGGYIALFILLVTYVSFMHNVKSIYKLFIIPVLFASIYLGYFEIEFLGSKIETQWDEQTSVNAQGTKTSGRFLGARKSLIAFTRHPIFGRGLIAQTAASSTEDEAGGYGFVSLLQRLGIFGFILWIFYFYKYPVKIAIENKMHRNIGIGFFLAMLVTNFGQAGYDKPLYLMVFFSGLLGYHFLSPRIYPSTEYRNAYQRNKFPEKLRSIHANPEST